MGAWACVLEDGAPDNGGCGRGLDGSGRRAGGGLRLAAGRPGTEERVQGGREQ